MKISECTSAMLLQKPLPQPCGIHPVKAALTA
jgi:hypothetical protein